MYLLH